MNEKIMNIQEMISKMDPKMLAQGLAQLSKGLSPEQLKQAEAAIKSVGEAKNLDGVDINSLQKELQQNPQMLKSLAQNPDLIEKLQKIIKK